MTNSTIKSGDTFKLGDHVLICGDCTDATLVGGIVGKQKISLILTDPPYGIAYVEGKEGFRKAKTAHTAIKNDHLQSDGEYRIFTRRWIETVKPFLQRKMLSTSLTLTGWCFHFEMECRMQAAIWRSCSCG